MANKTDELIDTFKRSNLSVKDFCNSQSIPTSTFYYHQKKSRTASVRKSAPSTSFVPVTPQMPQNAGSSITIVRYEGTVESVIKLLGALSF
jgi:hypothetical protein